MQLDSFRKGTGLLFQRSIIPKFRVKVMVRVSRSRVNKVIVSRVTLKVSTVRASEPLA